jgi:hypothetical protein
LDAADELGMRAATRLDREDSQWRTPRACLGRLRAVNWIVYAKRPFAGSDQVLLTRYRSEIRMLDIPAVVQKVAFPVLLALGTILGKYDKFKDAPEAVMEA